ncbi:putative cytochrome oxidase assembly [Erysiphe necator]|uniref:Putative cytochrome oxidase assembly n=1 Tax=Uncinula necator TaxID=52586 RepID=A0A0B1NWV6_UNCNE|nr:putative cytochrome oxidase assembly [Erysiphe necator]
MLGPLKNKISPRRLLRMELVRRTTLFERLIIQRRTLIAAPTPDQGPLMERRPDRELPVASTMYALRTSPKAREILGDEIYYAAKIPWIWGEINLLQGKIDIHFTVKGTKQHATMRFTSVRPTRMGLFETSEWSLTIENGDKFDLLEGYDPFKVIDADETEVRVPGRGSYAPDISK